MNVLLLALALLPPLSAIACLVVPGARTPARVAIGANALVLAGALAVAAGALGGAPAVGGGGWLLADPLAALVLCLVAVVALASSWYGAGYLPLVASELGARWTPQRFHALFQALVGSLVVAAIANNLGLLWIAIETSTLASAVLVSAYPRPGALEAAWKYLILCSVGVVFALLATVLLYASAVGVFGEGAAGLQWAALREVAPHLDARLLRLSFLFALVGYGAKAGLAPLHTWAPDAYGQAPTPVSATMSGGLLAVSLVALFRFHSLCARGLESPWSGGLLVVFGALSLLVSVPFLLLQGDYKRLLAYSSLENAGLVTLAVGFGTPLAVTGALFHLVGQSLAKALAFLLGGSLATGYGTRRMDRWIGVVETFPALAPLFAVSGIALAGLPPTSLFLSEWFALGGGLAGGHVLAVGVAFAALAVIFAGLAFHWTRMAIGRPRDDARMRVPAFAHAPLWGLAALLVLFGVWLPAPVRALIERAAEVLRP